MKSLIKSLGVFVAVAVPLVLASTYTISCFDTGYLLPLDQFFDGFLVHVSNCGGNSAAGSNCRYIALAAVVEGSDSNDVFDFAHTSQEILKEGGSIGRVWTPNAKYLIRTGQIRTGEGTHEIVVICDTAYGNVPQPTFWNLHHRTFRHAVGYSDGSLGWLTPAEYAALNKSNFFELKFVPLPAKAGTNTFE